MKNTYLISYEMQTEKSHCISDTQLGSKAASVNFSFDGRGGWRSFKAPLEAVTREEALAEFRKWKGRNKNSLDGKAHPLMRRPQLIEESVTVIAI